MIENWLQKDWETHNILINGSETYLSLYLVMASLPCRLRTYKSLDSLSSTTPLGLLVGGLSLTSHTNFPSLPNTHSLWFLLSATMMFPTASTTNPAGSESSPGPEPEHPKTFVFTVLGSRM